MKHCISWQLSVIKRKKIKNNFKITTLYSLSHINPFFRKMNRTNVLVADHGRQPFLLKNT